MSGGRIERLTLRHFRGATTETTLALDPSRPMVVIYGENGTGKSTLLDAIDMACNGKPGSLAGRSVGARGGASQYLAAAGCEPGDVFVEIVAGGAASSVSLNRSQRRRDGASPPPTAHVLRRRRMLDLVEATPGERYEAIREFVDVAGVEGAEAALGKAHREAKKGCERAQDDVSAAFDTLQRLWSEAGEPATANLVAWAEPIVSMKPAVIEARVRALEALLTSHRETIDASESCAEASAQVGECLRAADRLREELQQVAGEAGAVASLSELLTRAESHLAETPGADRCPVCDHSVRAADLRASVAERLRRMEQVTRLLAEVEAAEAGVARWDARAEERRRALEKAGQALAQAARVCRTPLEQKLALSWSGIERLLDSPQNCSMEPGESLVLALRDVMPEVEGLLDEVRRDRDLHRALSGALEKLRAAEGSIAALEAMEQRLGRAVARVAEERRRFVQETLDAASDECSRLYAQIHPGEPAGAIRIAMDPNQRASLLQTAEFGGADGALPQAYFSDSHLDTLGLCFFLAVTKQFTRRGGPGSLAGPSPREPEIVILDDVFTSLDEAHLARTAGLLAEESCSFAQLIVATHSREWRDALAAGCGVGVQLVELGPWSLEEGIRVVG